jgi:hypothetical protein
MCRNQGRPTAAEAIEHDAGPVRDVLDGVRDQGNRFDGRVQYELLVALDPESVHSTVLPNVRPMRETFGVTRLIQPMGTSSA